MLKIRTDSLQMCLNMAAQSFILFSKSDLLIAAAHCFTTVTPVYKLIFNVFPSRQSSYFDGIAVPHNATRGKFYPNFRNQSHN